jgi:type I restriction enzyme S subunit
MNLVPEWSLPECWSRTTLGNVRRDDTTILNPAKYPDERFELYSIPAHETGEPEIVDGRDIGSAKKTLSQDTVLLSKINPRINRVWVVRESVGFRQIGSSEWIAFCPIEGVVPGYLAHYLHQDRFRTYLASNVSGVGGSLMRVKAAVVDPFPFALPSSREQQRIVEAIDSYLTRLDDVVASLERVQAALKAYRASVLKAAVEGRLVPTEASIARAETRDYEPAEALLARILKERRRRWEEAELAKLMAARKTPRDDRWKAKYLEPVGPDTEGLRQLPEGWCWASLAQMATSDAHAIKAGPFGSALKKDFYTGTGYKIYGQEQVIRGDHAYGDYYIDEARYKSLSSCAVRPGDVLISLVGTIGRLLVLPNDAQPGIINPRLIKLSLESQLIDPNFFRVFFRSPSAQAQLRLESQGATMNVLNLSILRRLAVPLPPRSEQERIVLQADRLDSIGSELAVQASYGVARTNRLRQSVLKWAFEGKLVDQDPTDEPAERLLARIRADRAVVAPTKKTRRRTAKGVA